jgi:CHAT domain-containing protein/Tfp pilus assembly protein PilF
MKIKGELLGKNHPDYAQSLGNLGLLYRRMGDYPKADSLIRSSLEIKKRALGEHHPAYARSLNDLAGLYQDMADYVRSEPLFRQALEIRGELLGKNHTEYAASLNDLGLLYQALDDYAKAEPLLRHSLEITKRAEGENAEYATSLNNMAALYLNRQDNEKAEPLFRQALEIYKRERGENHSNYAGVLNNLSNLYRSGGEYAKAEPLNRLALEIYKRELGEDHPLYANCLNNLAALYEHMGDNGKAEPLYRRALVIRELALGENHPDYAISLRSLGLLYTHMGDYAKALPLIQQALAITKRALGENHPTYATSLKNLAELHYAQGQLPAAEQLLHQALNLLTRWTDDGLGMLGERQRIRLLELQGATLYAYLSVAPAAGIKIEELYRRVLEWKGVAEVRQKEHHLARDHPELKTALKEIEEARARLARMAFATPSFGQRQAWVQQFDALRDRKESLESELARKSDAFRPVVQTRRLGAAEVTAALPAGTALIDVLEYYHFSPVEGGKGPFRKERRLVAFVLRRGQAPVLVPLGASAPIKQAVLAWRQAITAGAPAPMQAASLVLSRRFWKPLEPHMEGATTVLVAPDGYATIFPLVALPGRRTGTFLVEDVAIGYVSSAHRLIETLATPAESKSKRPEAAGLLAIGGIDYQADPGGAAPTELASSPGALVADSQRATFVALAGTGPEVRTIGKLFGAAFPQQHALILTGAEPTEAAVKQQLGRRNRYLHLATHGFFESPARVAARRAGRGSDEIGSAGFGTSEESASLAMAPLLHLGVVLAGAARRAEDLGAGAEGSLLNREDGILTAEEVQSLDMRGTDLVVLSACQTGLGSSAPGQGGLMGLQRAFQTAGARAVVASLWKVDDAATTVLMEQFYTNRWSRKMPKLEALRQAQLTVLNNPGLVATHRAELAKQRGIDEKPDKLPKSGQPAQPDAHPPRSNPAHWAAFVLSGDVR